MAVPFTPHLIDALAPGPSTLETMSAPIARASAATPVPPTAAESRSNYAKQLAEVPELASYGPVLNSSSKPLQLTEAETEYQAAAVKHIFKEHIVFQVRYTMLQTINVTDQLFSSTFPTLSQTLCWKTSQSSCNQARTQASRKTSSFRSLR
jgi:hypothetical protein